MTLLVAAKVLSKNLNPESRPIQFLERGIILAEDTRFIYPGSEVIDDAQKNYTFGDWALAGYSGLVDVAERALICSTIAHNHHNWQRPDRLTLISEIPYDLPCMSNRGVVNGSRTWKKAKG
jgi:hypothetical protein